MSNSVRLKSLKTSFKFLSNAVKALKESIVPTNDYGIVEYQEKSPEVDWFTGNNWEDFNDKLSVNTTPYSLQIDYNKINNIKEKSISRSNNAITLFSGCDCVCIVNGKIIGEITGFRKHLNNDLNGNIDISFVRFDKEIIFPENTLFVAVYANEHGDTAYEVFHLNKITDIKSSICVDTIVPYVHERYNGKLVLPFNPLPDEVVNMTDEDFENMVNRVRNKCNHKEWLNLSEHPINHLTNRTYIWVLDNMFTSEQN